MACCKLRKTFNSRGTIIYHALLWIVLSPLSLAMPSLAHSSKNALIGMVGSFSKDKTYIPVDKLCMSWFIRRGFLRTANLFYKWLGTITFFSLAIVALCITIIFKL